MAVILAGAMVVRAAKSPALEPGAEVGGRWVIEALLGRGGMGAVYSATDRVLGERVALKTLTLADDASERDRFLREVRLARRITHKNVARTYDIGEQDGLHFFTMELVEGPSLRQIIRARGKIETDEALAIMSQVCDGLDAAHASGVIHRDLKPSNVLLSGARAVIVDFGVARALVDDQSLTRGVIGTAAYMAPEQLTSRPLDERTDLYALGLVLHEILTGALPVWGAAPGDMLQRLLEPSPPNLALPDPGSPIAELVRRLLEPDPARRPTSAREVAAALRAIGSVEVTEIERQPAVPSIRGAPGPGDRAPVSLQRPAPSSLPGPVFAPLPDAARTLAVLPFRERGGSAAGLGTDLAEELVDTLSRVRGLRVLASRATARFGTDADPAAVSKELGADFIVDGSVSRRGETLRVTARLLEAAGGLQVWSERFEGRLEEVVGFEEQMGQRIAEALRLEIAIVTSRRQAPAEAIELYLAGRRKTREGDWAGEDGAAALLERVVALAPAFRPGVAALALASVRRSFSALTRDESDFRAIAAGHVARALAEAPDLPEAQLAAGTLAAHAGDYLTAARHLRSAVTIAPTFAEAQEYLGHLQCEAGLNREGVRRLRQALELDPLLRLAPVDLARHHLLHGQEQEFERYVAETKLRSGGRGLVLGQLLIRAAAWRRDFVEMARLWGSFRDARVSGATLFQIYVEYLLEAEVGDEDARGLEDFPQQLVAPRLITVAHQMAAEAFGLRGQTARCLRQVELAASSALFDVEWLDLCPAIETARSDASFEAIRDRVHQRTQAIWSV